jgi:hypothetical protein
MLYDPIPDPIAAGWTKEGDEPHFPSGTSLRVTDTTNAGVVRFFVEAPTTAFAAEIELNPSVLLTPGFSVDGEQYTGVHVAINDGDREVRAAILGTEGAGVRVALALETGYTRGFVLATTQASFQLKRLADGTGVLAVPGQTPETPPYSQLVHSRRIGRQTLEFGSDGTGQVSISEWFTLGLRPLPRETPFAAFTVSRLQLRVRA